MLTIELEGDLDQMALRPLRILRFYENMVYFYANFIEVPSIPSFCIFSIQYIHVLFSKEKQHKEVTNYVASMCYTLRNVTTPCHKHLQPQSWESPVKMWLQLQRGLRKSVDSHLKHFSNCCYSFLSPTEKKCSCWAGNQELEPRTKISLATNMYYC